jgi:hypothetical protein
MKTYAKLEPTHREFSYLMMNEREDCPSDQRPPLDVTEIGRSPSKGPS